MIDFLKNQQTLNSSSFIFNMGDQLQYTANATAYNNTVLQDSPTDDTTYTFQMNESGSIATVSTASLANITQTSASSGGNVIADGGSPVNVRGVCWSTSPNPTTANYFTIDGSGLGIFISNLTGLTQNTQYYIRAYAVNGAGTAYGNELTFTTLQDVNYPTVTTAAVTDITQSTATSGGNVTSEGGTNVTTRGVCWSLTPNPTTANYFTIDGSGLGSFVSYLTGLTQNTQYYIRAYAVNGAGTAYGNELTFTTLQDVNYPTVTTAAVTDITQSTATSGGNVTSEGGTNVTTRGVCWSLTPNPTTANNFTIDGSGLGSFVSYLTGLTQNTQYYIRAYAVNGAGTAYGNELTFTTLQSNNLPTVTTVVVTDITQSTATSGGNVTSEGGTNVTTRGVCWSLTPNPTTANNFTIDGSGLGSFVSYLTGLTPNITYYVRAYATNSAGTSYGNEVTFTTTSTSFSCGQQLTYEGHVYNTLQIGRQCWLKENLNVGTRVNGGQTQMNNGIKEKYCYDNLESNCDIYGGLYQWDELMQYVYVSSQQGLCPSNWHVPLIGDLTTLETVLGGENISGGRMKEVGTSHWAAPNTGANNLSLFTGLPTGYRQEYTGGFQDFSLGGHLWSSTETATLTAAGINLQYNDALLHNSDVDKTRGIACRCIYDPVLDNVPYVVTSNITNITQTTATGGGNVTSDGGYNVTARGVCWGISSNPTTANSHTLDGSGTGTFISNLTALNGNTLYYIRAYAINSLGTGYGDELTFTTSPVLPSVTTTAVTNITQTTATSGGNVTSDGGYNVTARGVCWGISPNPTTANSHTWDGSGTGTFISNLTSLNGNTLYYIRAFAINSLGTGYGDELTFTTSPALPSLTTTAVTNITQTTATSGGNVTSDGGATVSSRGVCWSTAPSPTTADSYTLDGSGLGSFVSDLTGLTPSTLYYLRAYATNSAGTGYGNSVTFSTLNEACPGIPTVIYGGITYNTVLIGNQCWLKENLNIGTKIYQTQNQANNSIIEKYCYNNDDNNCTIYGGLYQWGEMMQYVTIEGTQGICPSGGWHIPSDVEWSALTTFLGGESVAGGKMKETGTSHWLSPNIATNESGFSAVGSGHRDNASFYAGLKDGGSIWSSTESSTTDGWKRLMTHGQVTLLVSTLPKNYGISVRCMKEAYLPTVTTTPLSNITFSTATGGGDVTSEGSTAVTVRGVCWSTSPSPTTSDSKTLDGSGGGIFISSVSGLTPSTQYYIRAYATNSAGTAYGNELTFTTLWQPCPGTPTVLYDGQTYNTVLIGTQCWLHENLNIGIRINGTQSQTNNSIVEKYCYADLESNCSTYGGLYRWDEMMQYVTTEGSQGICPSGWHLPTDAEWITLTTYLGGENIAGGKMKETGTTHWYSPNSGATNSSGFTGLPGGQGGNPFYNAGTNAYFWSSTHNTNYPWYSNLFYMTSSVTRGNDMSSNRGFSVRCLKN